MPLLEDFNSPKRFEKVTIQGIEVKGFKHDQKLFLYLKPFFKDSFEYSKKVATLLKAFPEHTCIHAGKLHFWDAEILPKLCVSFMDHCVLKNQIFAHLDPFFNLGGVFVVIICMFLWILMLMWPFRIIFFIVVTFFLQKNLEKFKKTQKK